MTCEGYYHTLVIIIILEHRAPIITLVKTKKHQMSDVPFSSTRGPTKVLQVYNKVRIYICQSVLSPV